MSAIKNYTWKQMPLAGNIPEAGNSAEYNSGSWRTYRPVWCKERCVQCLTCWFVCPDSAIVIKDGKVVGVDYEHCKGCGICIKECPPKAHAFDKELESKFIGMK